jgi:uncharacterized protein
MEGRTSIRLDRDACFERLRSRATGHVSFTSRALPAIAPVAYCLLGERLVFGTTRGSDLDRAIGAATVVAIAVDNIDDLPTDDAGPGTWTVLVTGRAGDLHHPAELHAAASRLDPGQSGGSFTSPIRYLQLSTDLMAGTVSP